MPPSWGYCWWTRTWSVSVAVGGWVQSSFLTFTQHFLSFYYFNSFIVVNSSNRNKNYHNSSWISMWIWPYIVRSSSSIISIAIAIVIAIGINQSVLRYEYYYYYCCCCCCYCCCCVGDIRLISIPAEDEDGERSMLLWLLLLLLLLWRWGFTTTKYFLGRDDAGDEWVEWVHRRR